MSDFSKVQPPVGSQFVRTRAIELANLTMVAYDEYEIWDEHGEQLGAPENKVIRGSSALVNLENYRDGQAEEYGRLDPRWNSEPAQVLEYKRLTNFWYTQFYVSDALEDVNKVLNTDVRDIWKTLARKMGVEKFDSQKIGKRDQTFGFIAQHESKESTDIFLVFRGTRENAEWFNNVRVGPLPFLEDDESKEAEPRFGRVRNGFYRIYNEKQGDLDTIRTTIDKTFKELLEKQERKEIKPLRVFITGHSLGAALATLAAAHLATTHKIKPILYTFASPRVGDKKFAENLTGLKEVYRIINSEDLVQATPLPTTLILDDEMLGDSELLKDSIEFIRKTIGKLVGGLTDMTYQHLGFPVGFTMQTGTVAGNHNLGSTYRNALEE